LQNLPIFYDSLQAAAGDRFESIDDAMIRKRYGTLSVCARSGQIFAVTDERNPGFSFLRRPNPQSPFAFLNGGETTPITGETSAEIEAIALVKRAAVYFTTPQSLGHPEFY
jgi:hypothetical protein